MNYGYQWKPIEENQWLAGDIDDPVINPSGQWSGHLLSPDIQKRGDIETQNCTEYGTENALKTLMHFKGCPTENYSGRYLGILSGNTGQGNDPQNVIETWRTFAGVIPEADLPFDDLIESVDDYYSPRPMLFKHVLKGLKWLRQYEINHEWVLHEPGLENQKQMMMEALKRSPLGAAVSAWTVDDTDSDVFVRAQQQDNHWVCIYGYEDGKYWYVFDSYDQTHKKLVWDYGFSRVKRYSIKPRTSLTFAFISRAFLSIARSTLIV